MLQFHDVTVYGEAIETMGFEAYETINGFGLLTFGLLWECPAIWTASETALTTSWVTSDSVLTTTWSNSDTSVTTTWSESTKGVWGEC